MTAAPLVSESGAMLATDSALDPFLCDPRGSVAEGKACLWW